MSDLSKLAALLDEAALNVTPVPQLSATGHALTLEEAYTVQALTMMRRQERGERLAGMKMGFTSRAKMVQMGISDLIWGRLSDSMLLEEGGTVRASRFIHPRIEPELAFLLKRRLAGDVTPLQAQSAIEAVAPALEIIDSRYQDFKFALPDVVADNASSSAVVVGAWQKPSVDLSNLGMVLSYDGRPMQIGSSAAILGHPLRSLIAAARLAASAGFALEPGYIVMAGAATAAEALKPGVHITLEVESLGRCEIGYS